MLALNKKNYTKAGLICIAGFVCLALLSSNAYAADESISIEDIKQGLDTVWVLLGAFLVFFMQAGFGMVEAGFIRAKNTCNKRTFLTFVWPRLVFF
jgi:Amt family ammonium transporter